MSTTLEITVKRTTVIRMLRAEARRRGMDFSMTELTNHTGITVGGIRSTLGRHREIDDVTARKFFDQFSSVLGKGWWR